MTPLKAFGFALLATLAATMLVGVGSSSATVLCEIEMEKCPKSMAYGAKTTITGHLVKGTVANMVFGSKTNVECKESTLGGSNKEKEKEPLPGEITSLEFGGCSLKAGGKTISCSSMKGTHLPFSASFAYSKETPGHGTLTLGNSGNGEPAIAFVCEKFKCTYAVEPSFEIGGEPTWASLTNAPVTYEEPACVLPEEGTFSATYDFSQPTSGNLFVAGAVAGATKLCQTEPQPTGVGGALECAAGQNYEGAAVEFTPVPFFGGVFSSGGDSVICSEFTIGGNFAETGLPAAMNGGIDLMILREEEGDCLTSFEAAAGGRAQVSMANLDYDRSAITYLQAGGPQGALGFEGANGPVRLRVVFTTPNVICEYRRRSLLGTITNGGAGSTIQISGEWGLEAQPGGCPGVLQQPANLNRLKFARPGNAALYVAQE